MNTSYRQLVPSAFEVWCVSLGALALLVAGNAKIFLQRYDLISSSAVVHQQLSSTVGSGLGVLDSYSFTPGLVTFMTWGIIGLFTFSLVQAFVRASGVIKFEREVGSNRYVHPQNFSQDSYWKRIVTDSAVSFALLVLLGVVAMMYLLFVIPVGFIYAQRFLLHAQVGTIVSLLLGVFTVFVGTAILYLLLKLVILHHRFSTQ
jgi:hypothetical protein